MGQNLLNPWAFLSAEPDLLKYIHEEYFSLSPQLCN